MNVYDYPKELNEALKYKREGKTFDQYESAVQNHLQPVECQIFWLLAEDVMDIVAEETNKETAELAKMLGEKDREINKLKKRLDKMSGNFDISDEEFGYKAIGQVFVTVSRDNIRYDGGLTDDVITAKTYDPRSSGTVSGRGLATSIEKSQALGNWFIIKDLDTGSKKAYRLNNIDSYAELRYPMVTEPAPVPEDTWKSWDPDERVYPPVKDYDRPMNEEEIERHKQYWDEKAAKEHLTRRCNGEHDDGDSSDYGNNGGGF